MKVRRTIAAALLALGFMAGLAGPAGASRADGVCGGVRYHWDPVSHQCVPD